MSHYTLVKTQLKNKAGIFAGLQCCGYLLEHIEVFDKPQKLYGYMGDIRPEEAEIIIRRKHVGNASNDIGIQKQKDGTYALIISEFDRTATWNTDKIRLFKQGYAEFTAQQLVQSKPSLKRRLDMDRMQRTQVGKRIRLRIPIK